MLESCKHCGTNVFPNTDRTCPQCRGDLDGAPAAKPMAHGLISHACPKCGGTEYQAVKPDRLVAFVYDRICQNCHIRYVPPTPLWAAIVFIVLGLALVGGAGADVLFHARDGEAVFTIWKLMFVGLGVISLVYGIRSLGRRRNVN